jgi:hypothetical protein
MFDRPPGPPAGFSTAARGYIPRMVGEAQEQHREALKRVATALKQSGIPFALIGGYAVWALGGPESDHDVDFLVAADDAEAAAKALADQGLQVEQPPEDWLFKVYTDDAMVDVIFRDSGQPTERAVVENAEEIEVLSVLMPVLSPTRVMAQKLNAMDEHACDFESVLAAGRALREQVDWDDVRCQTEGNAFAAAYLFLLERLQIIDPQAASET